MTSYTLKQCSDLLHNKQASATELAQDYLHAIEQRNPAINGYITLNKAADTISRDLTGRPLEQCSGADADRIIKTLMGKSDRSSDVPF